MISFDSMFVCCFVDSFAKMPPIETFMGIDPHTCRKHLYTVSINIFLL